MEVLTFSETRAKLKDVMDRVVDDHVPVVVSRRKAKAVVLVSLDDWNAIQETMHLISTPANAAALRESIAQADAGELIEVELCADGALRRTDDKDGKAA